MAINISIVCLFLFIGAISISLVGFSLYYGISPMPTSAKAKKGIFALIPSSQGTIYELGSGWGHLIFPMASVFSYAQIHAFEGSLFPYFFSKGVQKIFGLHNLSIQRKDFFTVSFKEADGIVCYLYPQAMERLEKKFQEELKPGAFIVTNTFTIPGWTPEKVLKIDDIWHSQVFLYRKA